MKRRKFISMFVCLCLLLTMIPAAAFAAESEPATDTPQPLPSQETTAQPQQNPTDSVESTEPTDPSMTPDPQPAPEPETQQTEEVQKQPQAEPTSEPAAAVEKEEKAIEPAAKLDAQKAQPSNTKKAASTEAVATVKKTAAGIKVTGGIEGKDWEYDSQNQTLTIKKNGLTVSGTATDSLNILCALAVTSVTMDNLRSGDNALALMSDNDQLDITLKGKNDILAIVGAGNVSINGTKNSQLDILLFAVAGKDLSIKNANITSSNLVGARDVNISGKSVVTTEGFGFLSPASILAGRNINVDLSTGGSLTAKGSKEVLPMLAGNKINLGKNSKLVTPSSGSTATIKVEGYPGKVIVDANGNVATDAVIKSGLSLTASATTNDASAVSPQTGDNGMNNVMWAFVLAAFAAAVLAALVIESRRHKAQ